MSKIVLGIDVSKLKFDVALLLANDKFKHKKFDNKPTGFSQLIEWLEKYVSSTQELHICMEATGHYNEALATFLFDAGFKVSVVNPAQIKGFAYSKLARTKTDQADAKLIAGFCLAMNPKAWQPYPPHIRELQALIRRLEALQNMDAQEHNRMESASEAVLPSIMAIRDKLAEEIVSIKKRIRDHIDRNPDMRDKKMLLETIPGIGESTIAQILAFMNVEAFENARQLAAFVGLNPKQRQSGSSVLGRSRLSKIGNANLRKAFYFPAIVATRFNPIIKSFSEKLRSNGKSKMVIIGAAMRKLVHIIYGVLKSHKPFNPALAA